MNKKTFKRNKRLIKKMNPIIYMVVYIIWGIITFLIGLELL